MKNLQIGDLVYSQGYCGMICDIKYNKAGHGDSYKIEWYYSANGHAYTYGEFQTSKWRQNFLHYYEQLKAW